MRALLQKTDAGGSERSVKKTKKSNALIESEAEGAGASGTEYEDTKKPSSSKKAVNDAAPSAKSKSKSKVAKEEDEIEPAEV